VINDFVAGAIHVRDAYFGAEEAGQRYDVDVVAFEVHGLDLLKVVN